MADLETMDPSEMEQDSDLMNAATKIQASFRGHMARKQAEKVGPTDAEIKEKEATEKVEEPKTGGDNEEEVDIDLNDPSVAEAAVKIQATFRGHMTRKTLKD